MSAEERKLNVEGHVYRYGLVNGTQCWYTGYSCMVAVDDETERLLAALLAARRENETLRDGLERVVAIEPASDTCKGATGAILRMKDFARAALAATHQEER